MILNSWTYSTKDSMKMCSIASDSDLQCLQQHLPTLSRQEMPLIQPSQFLLPLINARKSKFKILTDQGFIKKEPLGTACKDPHKTQARLPSHLSLFHTRQLRKLPVQTI